MSDRPTCTGLTRKGDPCKLPRLPGSMFCRQHTPNAGARVKLTDELIVQARGHFAKGLTVKDTAALLNVSEGQVYAWQRQGEKDAADDRGDTLAAKFSEAITRGRAEAREKMVAVLMDAAIGYTQEVEKFDTKTGEVKTVTEVVAKDWRAAAFFLERTDRDNWGRHVEDGKGAAGAAGEPVDIVPEADRRNEILAVLEAAGAIEAAKRTQPPA